MGKLIRHCGDSLVSPQENFLSEEEKNKEKIIDTSFLQVPKIKKSKTQGK